MIDERLLEIAKTTGTQKDSSFEFTEQQLQEYTKLVLDKIAADMYHMPDAFGTDYGMNGRYARYMLGYYKND